MSIRWKPFTRSTWSGQSGISGTPSSRAGLAKRLHDRARFRTASQGSSVSFAQRRVPLIRLGCRRNTAQPLRRPFRLALPDGHHFPAEPTQITHVAAVALDVCVEFRRSRTRRAISVCTRSGSPGDGARSSRARRRPCGVSAERCPAGRADPSGAGGSGSRRGAVRSAPAAPAPCPCRGCGTCSSCGALVRVGRSLR